MNIVHVLELPACDFCGAPAHYDGKTKFGPHGYMCESCKKSNGTQPMTKLEVIKKKEPKRTFDKVPVVTVPLSMDSVVTVKCPWCNQGRRVETDANYLVSCEACDKPYQLVSQF